MSYVCMHVWQMTALACPHASCPVAALLSLLAEREQLHAGHRQRQSLYRADTEKLRIIRYAGKAFKLATWFSSQGLTSPKASVTYVQYPPAPHIAIKVRIRTTAIPHYLYHPVLEYSHVKHHHEGYSSYQSYPRSGPDRMGRFPPRSAPC